MPDILVRPPGSSVLAFSVAMEEGVVKMIRATPHLARDRSRQFQSIGNFDSITGIHRQVQPDERRLKYLSGSPFEKPGDLIIDEVYATDNKLKVGDTPNAKELGMILARWAASSNRASSPACSNPIDYLQEKYAAQNKVSVVYVKVDDPKNIPMVLDELKQKLDDYKIFTMEEFISLISVDSIPILKQFTGVVIGLGVVIGFLVVALSMYMAVLERTREIEF